MPTILVFAGFVEQGFRHLRSGAGTLTPFGGWGARGSLLLHSGRGLRSPQRRLCNQVLSLASGNADVPLILDELPFHLGNPERRLCLRSRSLEQAVRLLPDEQATAKPDEAHPRGAESRRRSDPSARPRRTPGGGNRGPFRMLREEAGRPPTLNNTGSYVLLPVPAPQPLPGGLLGAPCAGSVR